ncbi:MAG TPA: hypothetical protein VNL94_08765 [Candidatus Binatia bacterium]|nr:hypothetical protein [Candidatus Binatia bacterium]
MNIARSLDIPLDLDGAVAVLAGGEVRAIDVGSGGGRPFLEIATIGLAAELLGHATDVSEGRLRSAIDLLGRAIRRRRTRVWLELDGREVRHRVVSLAIANSLITGRALKAAPDARIDDGLLDVVCYLGLGPLEVVRELASALAGVGSGTRTATYRAARVRVRTTTRSPFAPIPRISARRRSSSRRDGAPFGCSPLAADARLGEPPRHCPRLTALMLDRRLQQVWLGRCEVVRIIEVDVGAAAVELGSPGQNLTDCPEAVAALDVDVVIRRVEDPTERDPGVCAAGA